VPGGREGHRKRAADTMALQDERVDSTVGGVPPYIVCRYNTGILCGFPPVSLESERSVWEGGL
jgi:hypothetical protein